MRALGIDWSGARDPRIQRRSIWIGEAEDGRLLSLSGGRTRDEVADRLIDMARTTSPTVVGLDFSFGFPGWFALAHGARTGPEMWAVAAAEGEGWLERCDPPFWGRGGRPRPLDPGGVAWRRTEMEIPPKWARPKSIFQINGAGQVGTASIRGMAVLIRLRNAGIPVWPFDPWTDRGLVLAEVYPRWCTGPVVKSRHDARAAYLARRWPDIGGVEHAAATGSEDAFDAACTALTLSLSSGPDIEPDGVELLEGCVLAPSFAQLAPRVATAHE